MVGVLTLDLILFAGLVVLIPPSPKTYASTLTNCNASTLDVIGQMRADGYMASPVTGWTPKHGNHTWACEWIDPMDGHKIRADEGYVQRYNPDTKALTELRDLSIPTVIIYSANSQCTATLEVVREVKEELDRRL